MTRRMEERRVSEQGDERVEERRVEERDDEARRDEERAGETRVVETQTHERAHPVETTERVHRARGGFSLGAIFTGVMVAFGALFLLTALIGGIAVAVGIEQGLAANAAQIGVGIGIALVVAQFVSYLWGGYTAGRMARGSGALNGLLVPVLALVLVGAIVGLIAAFDGDIRINVAFATTQIPVQQEAATEFGIWLGAGALVTMFAGAILGGMLGARWHDKLEAQRVEDREVHLP